MECYYKVHDMVVSVNKQLHKKDRQKERIGVWCAGTLELCPKDHYKCLIKAECWNIRSV